MAELDDERDRHRAHEHLTDERLAGRGAPGRVTLTGRIPPSVGAIARAVASELRGPVQARGHLDGPDVHAAAARGMAGAGGTLPFFDQIQRAFGHHDVSGVRAHVGGAAAEASDELGAEAYASGDSVAFSAAPDLRLAAHEAAHVVQQRGGVRLSGGVGRAGDEYEQHADAVADLVVRGQSAQALLDPFAHRGAAGGPAIQRVRGEGMRALNRLLAGGERPTARRIVSIMRANPDEAHVMMERLRERNPALATSVEIEIHSSALELIPMLGATRPDARPVDLDPEADRRRGRGADPVGTDAPAPADRGVELPIEADETGGTVRVDEHASVGATVDAEAEIPLREVRLVVRGGDEDASGSVTTAIEPGRGGSLEVEGGGRPDGERGPTLRGRAGVGVRAGDEGGAEATASAALDIEVSLSERDTLRASAVIDSTGHLMVEAGLDLLRQRVDALPASHAAREPLLQLFVRYEHTPGSGEGGRDDDRVTGGLSIPMGAP